MSDQDFFFDEDEKPSAKSPSKSGSRPAGKSGSGSAKPAAGYTPSISSDFQTVSLTVAVLIAVIGVLLGVVIGLFVGRSMATPAISATSLSSGSSGAVVAPSLTDQQLNSGQLPAGHPKIDNSGTGSTTATSGK